MILRNRISPNLKLKIYKDVLEHKEDMRKMRGKK